MRLVCCAYCACKSTFQGDMPSICYAAAAALQAGALDARRPVVALFTWPGVFLGIRKRFFRALLASSKTLASRQPRAVEAFCSSCSLAGLRCLHLITGWPRGRSCLAFFAAVRPTALREPLPTRLPADALRCSTHHRGQTKHDPCHRNAPPGRPHLLGLAPRRAAHRVAHRRAAAVRPT